MLEKPFALQSTLMFAGVDSSLQMAFHSPSSQICTLVMLAIAQWSCSTCCSGVCDSIIIRPAALHPIGQNMQS